MRRRVVMTAAALGLTAAVTGVAVAMTTPDEPPPCEDGDARIEAVWSPPRALELDERWFGPSDLRLGIALDLLGEAARQQGRPADAVAFWRRHLALRADQVRPQEAARTAPRRAQRVIDGIPSQSPIHGVAQEAQRSGGPDYSGVYS